MVSIPKVDAVGPKAVNAILFLPISEHLAVPLTRQLSRQAQTRAGSRQTMPWTATQLPHMTGGSRVQPPPLPRLPGLDPAGRLPHVAFVSSDFGQTVMLSFLMSPFSLHRRKRKQVHEFDAGHFRTQWRFVSLNGEAHSQSTWRAQLIESADMFDEMGEASDAHVAAALNGWGVDVIVFLDGHNRGSRLSLLALNPARVQVSYRFAASTGADFVSHYVADATVAPPELVSASRSAANLAERGLFSEKMVLMPGACVGGWGVR